MLFCDPFRLTWSPGATLWCCKSFLGAAQSSPGQGGIDTTRRDWDFEVFRRTRDDFFGKIGDMDSSCLILVTFRNNLVKENVSQGEYKIENYPRNIVPQ